MEHSIILDEGVKNTEHCSLVTLLQQNKIQSMQRTSLYQKRKALEDKAPLQFRGALMCNKQKYKTDQNGMQESTGKEARKRSLLHATVHMGKQVEEETDQVESVAHASRRRSSECS